MSRIDKMAKGGNPYPTEEQMLEFLNSTPTSIHNAAIDKAIEVVKEDVSSQSSWDDEPQRTMIEDIILKLNQLKK